MFPIVSNSTVDREEAYGIAQVRPGHGNVPYRNCSDCLLPTNQFHNGHAHAARRTVETERHRVQVAMQLEEQGDHAVAERMMRHFGSHMAENPLHGLPMYGMEGLGPHSAVSWAQMHNYYKGQYENVVKLILVDLIDQVYGGDAVPMREAVEEWVMVHGVAFPTINEHFPDGFNDFTGWDKRHWAVLSRVLRCAIHGVFDDGQPLEVLGRLTEWWSIAKLPIHSEDTLQLLHEQLWPQYTDARNRALQHLDITNFNKDKCHQPVHLKEKLENYGVLDGQNDEGSETSHKWNIKDNWRCRNNKNPVQQQQQVANNLTLFDTARGLQELHKHHMMRKAHEGTAPMAAAPHSLCIRLVVLLVCRATGCRARRFC